MDKINHVYNFVQNNINDNIQKIVFSNVINKQNIYKKITVIPKNIKNCVMFQITYYYLQKVKHENIEKKEITEKIMDLVNIGFKQVDFIMSGENTKILTKDNVNFKIVSKKTDNMQKEIRNHDNIKKYILKEGEPIDWLVKLNIMNFEGKVLNDKRKKFKQINHFLDMIQTVYKHLPDEPVIIDFGCGKSYLTFALHYFLMSKNKKATIIGLDLKEDVVKYCNELAEEFNFNSLKFINSDIKDFNLLNYNGMQKINMVITLHACDTATDYALFNAIKWKSDVILAVPCCQHEIYKQIKNNSLNQMLKHGILKERFASLLTDTIRGSLLDAAGYKTNIIEFIDMEHTPKNIMIRAVAKNGFLPNLNALKETENLQREYNVRHKLYNLLKDRFKHLH